MSDDWRRIDIDKLDPDNQITQEDLIGYEIPPISDAEIQQQISHIRQFITRGTHNDAIEYITSNPPYGASESGKISFNNAIVELFGVVKQSDIENIVQSLQAEQQTVLVKYIYKGFSTDLGKKQGGILLTWYDKTISVTGIGPVVRYLSDRRVV